jgi:hypothetical protein
MVPSTTYSASILLLGGLLAFSSPIPAAWSVSGTVKSTTGTNLDGVAVTVKDSAATLKATTANGGQFSIVQSVGVHDRVSPLEFSVHQFGNELLIAFPGSGVVELSLVDVSGSVLWSGKSNLVDGYVRTTVPTSTFVGPAILRVASGTRYASQLVTMLGGEGVRLTPRVSARSMAAFPTLVFKKVGYADTTFVMTASSQTGITVAMRDSTTPKSTVCKLPPSPNTGAGSFTKYYFAQGTTLEGGFYRTACGYRGTETGGESSGKMNNIVNPQYFLAIPGNSPDDFNTRDMCGACVELTGQNGTKLIATITDECPLVDDAGRAINQPCRDNKSGHLDVSFPALSKLGFSVGNPSGTSWKYVKCPTTGNIVVRLHSGDMKFVYIENTILPIKSVKSGSYVGERQRGGFWNIFRNGRGATLSITDYSDRTITVTVPQTLAVDTDHNTGVQFPACQ